jgi:hypothetical protein
MVWLATMLVVLGQAAGVSEFRGVTYVKPAGWAEQNEPEVRLLVAPQSRQGELVVLMIFAAHPATNDPAAELKAFADQAEQKGRRLSRGGLERKAFGPYQALLMGSKVDLPGVGQHSRIYELVTDGKTTALATAMYRGDASFAANEATLLQTMASVKPGGAQQAQGSAPSPRREAPAPQAASAGGGGIPYGTTTAPVSDKAFRPSGRGVPIPPPSLERGVPLGLWWCVYVSKYGESLYPKVFLPDGTAVDFFRPGGPSLVDLDGMRARGEAGYIGRYEVSGGVLTTTFGKSRVSKPLVAHSTAEGPYFVWDSSEYQPAIALSRQALLGTWRRGAQGTYTFRADGTVVTTPAMIDAQWTHKNNHEQLIGTWALDGYLLALQFPVDGARVYYAFRSTKGGLIINQSLLTRE